MSKIQTALGKARDSQGDPQPSATNTSATNRRAENSEAQSQSTPIDQSGVFKRLQGFGQLQPIADEIAESNRIISSPRYVQESSSYKILRTRVLHRMRTNNWKRLAITSCGPSEGKTLTSINLAISLARREKQNVVLVDLDLIRPAVCRTLGIEPVVGLSEYFSGTASIEQILISPGIDRLLILATDEPIENSSETLRSAKMLELLEYVSSQDSSTIVVFDMPPLLSSDDVLAFGPLVDAILLVVSSGKTARSSLDKAKELLEEFNLMGTTLNMSNESPTSYY